MKVRMNHKLAFLFCALFLIARTGYSQVLGDEDKDVFNQERHLDEKP